MNPKAFRQIAKLIETTDRFNLEVIADGDGGGGHHLDVQPARLWRDCGTVGCVLGWTAAQLDIKSYSYVETLVFGLAWTLSAKQVLDFFGINAHQAEVLFGFQANSIWVQLAPRFGWKVDDVADEDGIGPSGELKDPSEVTAKQAGQVLRMIASGEIEL